MHPRCECKLCVLHPSSVASRRGYIEGLARCSGELRPEHAVRALAPLLACRKCYTRVVTITLQRASRIVASKPSYTASSWLLFILTLQGQQPAVRMRVWRGLKALGAAVLRDGVYLLPNRNEFLESLQAQSDEVTASGGSAQTFQVDARDEQQAAEFRQLFDRTADYEKLMLDLSAARRQIEQLDKAALSSRLTRLARDYEAIALQDFFAGAARDQAREILQDLVGVANATLSPDEPHFASGRIKRLDPAKYRGRTWATRAHPWADRLASAWLITRCIDRRAKFLWLSRPKDCPKRAVGFDFDGAEFTHVGAKVTFEVLLASFGLNRDPALERIGALIHYLDVGGVSVPEAAGLEALLRGARDALSDDDALLSEACKLLDYLYTHYATGR